MKKNFAFVGLICLGWVVSSLLYFSVVGFDKVESWHSDLAETSIVFFGLPIWIAPIIGAAIIHAICYGKKHGWPKIVGDKIYLLSRFIFHD